MARTYLAPQDLADGGMVPVLTQANADGHMIDGGGDIILMLSNTSGAPITVTVETAATVEGYAVADEPIVVANGDTRRLSKRFTPRVFDRPSGAIDAGMVYVNFSAAPATMTVAAIRV